jgi:hypothetical protein
MARIESPCSELQQLILLFKVSQLFQKRHRLHTKTGPLLSCIGEMQRLYQIHYIAGRIIDTPPLPLPPSIT